MPDSKTQFLTRNEFTQGNSLIGQGKVQGFVASILSWLGTMSTHDLSSDEDDSMLEDHPHHRGLFGGPGAISDDDELTDGKSIVTLLY